jgi:repressor LexA
MNGLTKRQREIIDFIQEFIKEQRYSPSYREIMAHFGFSSPGTLYRHIQSLKKKGLMLSDPKIARSLMPNEGLEVKPRLYDIDLPLIGFISAGSPIETFEKTQTIAIPECFVHSPEHTYVLRARGDSLVEEQIASGDLLVVEARQEALSGETIIGLINENNTIIKRYYPEGDYIRLEANALSHQSIILRHGDLVIQGVVVALLRSY